MIKSSETFQGTWPFLPNFFDGNGFLMHYVDEGPREAKPIILLHGEPTWGIDKENLYLNCQKHIGLLFQI